MSESYSVLDSDLEWWVSEDGERYTFIGRNGDEDGATRDLDWIAEFYGILDDGLTLEESHVPDAVKHPAHYTSHPSGIEVIEITRHMGFCLGNVVKYVLRADLKNDAIEDLRKAIQYLEFEIETREMATHNNETL